MKKYIALGVIGLVGFLAILYWVGIEKISSIIIAIDIFYFSISVAFLVISLVIRAWRWKLIISEKGVGTIPLFWIISAGLLINAILPIRIGEFARAFMLKVKSKIAFMHGFSTVVLERLLDLLCLAALGLIALFFIPVGPEFPSWLIDAPRFVALVVTVALIILIIGSRKEESLITITNSITRFFLFPKKWRKKVLDIVISTLKGIRVLKGSKLIQFVIAVRTLLVWLTQFFSLYYLFLAFNLNPKLMVVLLGSVAINLSFAIPAPPGYVGTYEAYWLAIFYALGYRQTDIMLAMALISHVSTLAILALFGFLGIAWTGLSLSELIRAKERREEREEKR